MKRFFPFYIYNMKDYIIVGFGFAGVALAHLLNKNQKDFVVFDDVSSSSTSISGALYNPVVLKRFTPVWKATQQIQLLQNFYVEMQEDLGVKLIAPIRILRKFASLEEQNNWFVASDKPELSSFLSTKIIKEINSYINTPFGLGEVLHTGRILTNNMLSAYRDKINKKNIFYKEKFDYSAVKFHKEGVLYKGIVAKRIVFCEGYAVMKNPYFTYLPMQGCKGELLTFSAPDLHIKDIIKSAGFIFPNQENTYKVGATYNYKDTTDAITEQGKEELIDKLKNLISCDFTIINQQAAVRPTVLDRRPLVGVHPEIQNMFILNGLGTRGAMLAPYTATALFDFIEKEKPLEKEMNISRFQKRYRLRNQK